MARPAKPLISRSAALSAAIDIIDAEGLETFTLPRLAKELGVRTPSLYHHFRDRDDLLLNVVRRVVTAAVPAPELAPGYHWHEYFVQLAVNFRLAALRHRNAAHLLLHYRPSDVLPGGYEAAAKFLRECGVPIHLHVRILDGVETLMMGTILSETINPFLSQNAGFNGVDPQTEPVLTMAVQACTKDSHDLFEAEVRAFLTGVSRGSCEPEG